MSLSPKVFSTRVISFISNDYLGLSQHITVQREAARAVYQYGTNISVAPSAGGYTVLQQTLEQALSAFLQTADSLIYPAGWSATVGVISTLVEPGDLVFFDEGVHPSVIAIAQQGVSKRLPHNSPTALEATLQQSPAECRQRWVVVHGVYPQDGDVSSLKAYLDIAERHQALLIVDDTDGIGVFGSKGAGRLEEEGILGRVPIVTEGSTNRSARLVGLPRNGKSLSTASVVVPTGRVMPWRSPALPRNGPQIARNPTAIRLPAKRATGQGRLCANQAS